MELFFGPVSKIEAPKRNFCRTIVLRKVRIFGEPSNILFSFVFKKIKMVGVPASKNQALKDIK